MNPLQQLTETIYTALPELKELGVDSKEVNLLGLAEPYSLESVLSKLIDASNILLHDKNYDGHGWELLSEANKKASDYIERIHNYQSLGKKITITDVLRWIQTLNVNSVEAIVKLLNLWNLSENLIENQSIELVEFLNNLKKC